MDAAGVHAQQYDSDVNDRDQVFVDCIDTDANTEQRHDRSSDSEETDPHGPPYTTCASTADIQSATDEIRRGKKKERKKKPQGKNIMFASATQGGHNKHRSKHSSAKIWCE